MQLFRLLFMLVLGVMLGWVLTGRGLLPMPASRYDVSGESQPAHSSWSDSEVEAATVEAGTESPAGESIRIPAGAQTIEVNIRGKYVTLYFGMPKEQVKQVLGRPGKSDMSGSGNSVWEKWKYYINNKSYSDLDISFYNGKLESVHQY